MCENQEYGKKSTLEVDKLSMENAYEDESKVNFEQNINIVNVDMCKESSSGFGFKTIESFVRNHIVAVLAGALIITYAILLFVIGFHFFQKIIIPKQDIAIESDENITDIVVEGIIDNNDAKGKQDAEKTYITNINSDYLTESIENEDDLIDSEDEYTIDSEITSETLLYDLPLIGNNYSEKATSATNTIGEKLENVFLLKGGTYEEITGFYLGGKYDRFFANISCIEGISNECTVSIYFDDDTTPVDTIDIVEMMERTPIDLRVKDVRFIKFAVSGEFFSHGAILSDGKLLATEISDEN